jgi:DNA (cytosine-5)-methyltransferase 1
MKKEKKKFKVLSLFSGCGGTDLGFLGGFEYLGKKYSKRNYEIIWANDIDEASCVTYEKNFGHTSLCADIRDVLSEKTLFNDSRLPDKADIVLGGFPCQDFSLSGKRRGFNSQRGLLYQSMAEVIKRTKPLVFVAENVKGLLSVHNGEAIEIIKKDFAKLGYNISVHLYHAADFGIPQSRERVIIVGTNKKAGLPEFKHIPPKSDPSNWVTLKKAIGDLENIEEGSFPNHFWSRAKMFPGTQGNAIVNPDKIGPTMRAEHHGNIEWHWNKKRRLSAREAARIQSFPDNFIFYPSTSAAYKQIGNAVAPVMAWNIAKNIEDFLFEHL